MNLRHIIAASFLTTATLTLTGCHGYRDLSDPANRQKISKYAASHLQDRLEDLDATDSQLKSLEGVEKPVLEEAFSFYDSHQVAKKAAIAEWNSAKADPVKVHQLIDDRVEALRKVLHTAGDAAIKIQGVLTPEQRAEVAERFDCR